MERVLYVLGRITERRFINIHRCIPSALNSKSIFARSVVYSCLVLLVQIPLIAATLASIRLFQVE